MTRNEELINKYKLMIEEMQNLIKLYPAPKISNLIGKVCILEEVISDLTDEKKDSEFENWLKQQHLEEVITKEYKFREIILDEKFVLAMFEENKKQ